MFETIPLTDVSCLERPRLPQQKVQNSSTNRSEPAENFVAPWFILSLCHSSRFGRQGWADQLDRLATLGEDELLGLAAELESTASTPLKPLVQSWMDGVLAMRAMISESEQGNSDSTNSVDARQGAIAA